MLGALGPRASYLLPMSSAKLLVVAAVVGGVLSVAFVALSGTGAPGLYAALFVACLVGLALSAWNDQRQRRPGRPHR